MNSKYGLITIIGPTASGKTPFAAHLAYQLQTEIISGDSRQLYQQMDIGTGKDLVDYMVNNTPIPYHLIDIVKPGHKYNVYEYQRDFLVAYKQIIAQNKVPILCGGTGMYIEAVLAGYKLLEVPPNLALRADLECKTLAELARQLASYQKLHNNTDLENKRRAIRAIEIAEYYLHHPQLDQDYPSLNPIIIGLDIERNLRREKITKRLHQRLEEGMIDEIKQLLKDGISAEDLIYYGLEYKFITQHVIGQISFHEMVSSLEIAIHQFAKRQMTWFRGMERRGYKIHWIDASISIQQNIEKVLTFL